MHSVAIITRPSRSSRSCGRDQRAHGVSSDVCYSPERATEQVNREGGHMSAGSRDRLETGRGTRKGRTVSIVVALKLPWGKPVTEAPAQIDNGRAGLSVVPLEPG